jgi:hypothetical protein
MSFKCKYCDKILSTKYTLLNHQKLTKRCLELQNKEIGIDNSYKCDYCEYTTLRKENHTKHLIICKKNNKTIIEKYEQTISEMENTISEMENKISEKDKIINDQKLENIILKTKLECHLEICNLEKFNCGNNIFRSKIKETKDELSKFQEDEQNNENILNIKTQNEEQTNTTILLKKTLAIYEKQHHYPKFNIQGPVYYIVSNSECNDECPSSNRFKHGIAGTRAKSTFDSRLQSHRTSMPFLHVDFVVMYKNPRMIEQFMENIFEKQLNPNHKEFFQGEDKYFKNIFIDKVISFLEMSHDKDYKILSNNQIDHYNIDVDTTKKQNCISSKIETINE